MLQTRKYGKYVLIGSEDVEVFPVHCADGHHCVQCWFEGKTYCAPRFWGYSKPELNRWKYQKPRKGGYTSLVSLEALMRLPRYTGIRRPASSADTRWRFHRGNHRQADCPDRAEKRNASSTNRYILPPVRLSHVPVFGRHT